jgi:RNA polymerase sigma factor (sigma-70 family)
LEHEMSGPDSGQLRYALAQLPAEDRAVLRHAFYEHRTTAQIAADLGISEEAVKSSLHGALRTLWPRLREL